MSTFKRLLLICVIVLVCTGCDQSTKFLASEFLAPNIVISYANDIFRFQYAENSGAFLGLGSNLSEETRFNIFIIAVSLTLVCLFFYTLLNKKINTLHIFAFSIILSGGFSNLIDRIVNQGAVVDFLNIGFGQLRTGIFNIADVFILFGFVIIMISTYKLEETKQT